MALTTATFVEAKNPDTPGTVGRLRARRGTVTFTAGYDSAFGVTLKASALGLSEIVAVIPEGTAAGTAAGASVRSVIASGNATLTLFNGTTLVATADESATTLPVLVLGH